MLRSLLALLFCFAAASASAVELKGPFTQGGLLIGQTEPGAAVRLNGESVRVAPDGRFAIGFGRDAELEHRLEVVGPGGAIDRRTILLAKRDYNIERVEGLPPKTVTLPPEYYERRERETGMVRAARGHDSDLLHWTEGFAWPAYGRISGVYGSQRILNGEPRWPHLGIDVAAPEGTPVTAPGAGIVRLAEPDFLLEGGIVIIDHGYGVSSTLMHLQSVGVSAGQMLEQGETIGTLGATGRATGPHVDWRINWGAERLDPGLLMGPMPDQAADR